MTSTPLTAMGLRISNESEHDNEPLTFFSQERTLNGLLAFSPYLPQYNEKSQLHGTAA